MFGKAYTFYPKVPFRKHKTPKGNKKQQQQQQTGQHGSVRSTARSDFQRKTGLKVTGFSKLQKTILHFKSNSCIPDKIQTVEKCIQ